MKHFLGNDWYHINDCLAKKIYDDCIHNHNEDTLIDNAHNFVAYTIEHVELGLIEPYHPLWYTIAFYRAVLRTIQSEEAWKNYLFSDQSDYESRYSEILKIIRMYVSIIKSEINYGWLDEYDAYEVEYHTDFASKFYRVLITTYHPEAEENQDIDLTNTEYYTNQFGFPKKFSSLEEIYETFGKK